MVNEVQFRYSFRILFPPPTPICNYNYPFCLFCFFFYICISSAIRISPSLFSHSVFLFAVRIFQPFHSCTDDLVTLGGERRGQLQTRTGAYFLLGANKKTPDEGAYHFPSLQTLAYDNKLLLHINWPVYTMNERFVVIDIGNYYHLFNHRYQAHSSSLSGFGLAIYA